MERELKAIHEEESLQNITEVIEYLKEKKRCLESDYKRLDGSPEACSLIAFELAKILLEKGFSPFFMTVSEDQNDGNFISSKQLFPQLYKGKVRFSAHVVCCCEEQAFDPLIGHPIPIKDYTRAVFGEEIRIRKSLTKEYIEQTLKRLDL